MFGALPRKVDTMLPRAAERTLARVEPNRSISLSRGKGISVCCGLSVETVLWRSCGVDQQPHAAAALRCWTRTRLLTHKQMREFAVRNRYPALEVLELSGFAIGRQLVTAHMQRVLATLSLTDFFENVCWILLKI
jgi:hypothetical protein